MEIKGNITLLSGGASEIQNAVIERMANISFPAVNSLEKGRIIFGTTDNKYYYNDGAAWVAIATGGSATALQNEIDALEISLGSSITAAGTFDTSPFAANAYTSGATSVTDAIIKVATAVVGHDTLVELTDVSALGATQGQFLQKGLTSWINHTLVQADVSDVTATAAEINQLHLSGVSTADLVKLHATAATAAELNILSGATLSTIELNYVTGVTSSIQTQLNNKQALDAALTSISGLNAGLNDLIFGTAIADVYVLDSGAGARSRLGLTIGTDVQAFDADLLTIAGFAPAINSSEVIISNAITLTHNGVRDIMVSTGGAEGFRWELARGASARTALGMGDIAIHDDAEYMRVDGLHTMSADMPMGNHQIIGLSVPTVDSNAATKLYVDQLVTGMTWKNAVHAATVADIILSGTQIIDTVAVAVGDRVLVKNQAIASQNGIYIVSATAWTRAVDLDVAVEFLNASVLVQSGTQTHTAWTCTSDVVTVDTTPVAFVQFNGAQGIVAGLGLSMTGNVIDINFGAGIAQLPTDEVGLDLYDVATGALILTSTGSDRGTGTNHKLHLLTNIVQFVQDAAGLSIKAAGVGPAELAASVAGAGLIGGAGTAISVASAPGTAGTVGTIVVTADSVGVALGSTSTTAAPGDHIHAAAAVTFSPIGTILATDVQAAIAEVSGDVTALTGTSTSMQSEIDAIETAAGLNINGTLTAFTGANYVATDTSLRAAVVTLDGALKTEETARVALSNKVSAGYHLYTGVSATSHTVIHNMNCMYANVTVVDATNNVIIPQSIVFDTVNQLTVTFNAAIACKVVSMGLNGAA